MRRHRILTAAALVVGAVLAGSTGVVVGSDSTAALADDDWSWPTDPPRTVLRAFAGPAKSWMPGHRGIDLAASSPVLRAPADGVVHFAGVVVDRDVLSIDHGGGVLSSYEPVTALVVEGEAVERGQVIGTISAGHCASLCVHLGVRVDGEYRNPLLWLGGAQWPVLLPTRRG